MAPAIANRQDLADQPHWQGDELEGMEQAPCGLRNPDEPDCHCISEVGHKGRHKYRRLNRLVD